VRLPLWNWISVALLVCVSAATYAQYPTLPSQPVPVTPASAQETTSPAPPAAMPANPSSQLPPPNALPGNAPAPPSPGYMQPAAPPPGYLQPVPPPPGAVLVQPVPMPPPRGTYLYEPMGAWFNADYLLWWTKGTHVPQLVTPGVPEGSGTIGPAEPTLLYPGGSGDFGARSGGKFDLGFWFSENHVLGMEASYLFLGTDRTTLASGLESSAVAPVSDPPVMPPGLPFGNFAVTESSFLQSAEVNLLGCLCNSSNWRLEVLAGFRFMELDEKLHVTQEFFSADGSENDTWDDGWNTRNDFYGGQIGARATFTRDRFFADVGGQVALGVTYQRIDINGSLTQSVLSPGFDSFGNPVTNVQVAQSSPGLLTQPASFSRDIFAVVPQFNFDVGYEFNNFCRASLGYEFLYWSTVVRPGDQVGGIPKATNFWAQGLVFSLGFMF
jgi:Putative beta barrel porin-7 (BBP7)